MPAAPANPWTDRRVLVYGHQGGAREGPSSTLRAFADAIAHGADALEMDVHATADGHLVVCHDATVDRTTDGAGAIATLTLAEVRALDNAYWWTPGEVVDHDPARPASDYPHRGKAPADTQFAIALLDEVLDAFPTTFLNFDIKQTAPVVEPYEAALARALEAHGRSTDVIVASFNDAATDAFAAAAPHIHTSAGTAATAEFVRAVQHGGALPEWVAQRRHVALQVPPAFGETVIVDEPFVSAAHGAGIAVHVWTIDDAAEVERLVALDVDGIMTDRPTMAAEVVGRMGRTWRP